MSFTINPILYFFMIIIETFLCFYICYGLTKMKFDKKKGLIGVVLVTVVIFTLDMFVFDMTKTTLRTLINMLLLFVAIKSISHATWIQSLIQTFILFAVLLIIDMTTVLIIKGASNYVELSFDNFAVIYGIYLSCMSVVSVLLSKLNIKIFRVERLRV